MKLDQKQTTLLEKFIQKSLTKSEEKEFIQMIKNNDDFRATAIQEQAIADAIRNKTIKELKVALNNIDESMGDVEESKVKNLFVTSSKYYMPIAASFVILILGIYYSMSGNVDSAALYQKYFEVYPNISMSITRGEERNAEDQMARGFEYYEMQQYGEVVKLFTNMTENANDPTVLFYLGNSYMALGEENKAIEVFNKILEGEGDYDYQANWYLGLAYLKAGQVEEAKKTFQLIVSQDNSYSKKASEILNKLD